MKKAFLITAGVLLASLTVDHHYQQHQAKQALRRQYRAAPVAYRLYGFRTKS